MKKRSRQSVALVFLFATIFFLFGCGDRRTEKEPRDAKTTIDFSTIPDGTYRGTFTYGAFNFIVEVTAADGQVTDVIAVQNRDNEPSIEAEAVLGRVVDAQSLEVDVVSGATASSKALLKAAENAIKKALQ